MSYILDALRRSELERKQGKTFTMSDVAPESTVASIWHENRLMLVSGLAAVGLFAIVGYFLLNTRTADLRPVSGEIPISANQAASITAPPAPTVGGQSKSESVTMTPPPAPVLKPAPFATTPHNSEVRNLSEQTRVSRRKPEKTTDDSLSIVSATNSETVRFLRAMSPEFQRSLPEMAVNIHVYAHEELQRILYINNRQYQAGDKVRDDIVVEEIVEDGVVLNYRGQRFKLPRPS